MSVRIIRGFHVFLAIGVFFGLMIALEAFFVFRAITTFPGEDVRNSYVMGLDFNTTLARREEQRRIGWNVEAGVDDASRLIVRIADSERAPVGGLDVTVSVHRMGRAEEGATLSLNERSAGEYVTLLGTTGRVRLAIEARRAGESGAVFEASKTLVIP